MGNYLPFLFDRLAVLGALPRLAQRPAQIRASPTEGAQLAQGSDLGVNLEVETSDPEIGTQSSFTFDQEYSILLQPRPFASWVRLGLSWSSNLYSAGAYTVSGRNDCSGGGTGSFPVVRVSAGFKTVHI